MLGVFRKIFNANDRYSLPHCENLSSPIQLKLSLRQNTVSKPVVPFLESTSNFKHFGKEYDLHSYFISQIKHSEGPD